MNNNVRGVGYCECGRKIIIATEGAVQYVQQQAPMRKPYKRFTRPKFNYKKKYYNKNNEEEDEEDDD